MGIDSMLMTGLGLQLKFAGLLFGNEDAWFDPYVRVGANYLRHDYTGLTFPVTDSYNDVTYAGYSENKPYTQGRADHFALSTGLGTNIWLTKNFGLGIQGDYVSTPVDKSRLANFWQASASLNFRFGNRDKDKDGVLDKDDACPETPGLPEFQGCPDTDGDGVPDKDDNCLEVAGPVENNGCPWPDTDNDGVLDKDDACPEVAGPVENNGCPWPDTDNDGVLDKDDKCPSVPGLPEYNGCPKPQSEYAKDATGALQGIFFHFNKSSIRPESNTKLDQAAEVIKSSNGGTFLVVGHTDVKGNANYNLKLSRERAASVVAALEARGVSPSQLKSKGVGSAEATVPASASNEERMKDRKVVVEAISGSAWEALQKSDLPVVKKKVVKKKRK
uniref:OmpA n=1 Tax=Riemerella anatipestifer TaxID=34085 RepID=Q6E1Y9_RIEAN|nr:OmpA [Riemerella anatipestifer]